MHRYPFLYSIDCTVKIILSFDSYCDKMQSNLQIYEGDEAIGLLLKMLRIACLTAY
jgi:hypothetical protein